MDDATLTVNRSGADTADEASEDDNVDFTPMECTTCGAISEVVRSTLLRVTGGRQTAWRGFLQSVLPDPL